MMSAVAASRSAHWDRARRHGDHTASAQSASACPSPAQTADPVPVRVQAPGEVLELRIADNDREARVRLDVRAALPPRTGMIFVFTDGDN